jgi:hypothetical protein
MHEWATYQGSLTKACASVIICLSTLRIQSTAMTDVNNDEPIAWPSWFVPGTALGQLSVTLNQGWQVT